MSHTTVDVRHLIPRERHPLIFSSFDKLPIGQAMELVNDHDPRPLYYQFHAELPAASAGMCSRRGRTPGASASPS